MLVAAAAGVDVSSGAGDAAALSAAEVTTVIANNSAAPLRMA
jgi:hypothetical protein